MSILLTILAAIGYFTIATAVKVYYKLKRHDGILSEEPYMIGAFWPIYGLWRLVAALAKLAFWPFVFASKALEDKIEKMQEAKREQARVRVSNSRYDRELREAEEEVEDMLTPKERFRHL